MILTLPRWCLMLMWPLFIVACATTNSSLPPGELGRQFVATIPGTWKCVVKSNGMSSEMVKVFKPDGTAAGMILLKLSKSGASIVMPEITFTSRWRVVGDVLETYDVKASAPKLFRENEVIRDQLISVKPMRIVHRSMSRDGIEILERVTSSR